MARVSYGYRTLSLMKSLYLSSVLCVPNLDSSWPAMYTVNSYTGPIQTGPITFNWTILILEDTGSNLKFVIKFNIQSHRREGSANCPKILKIMLIDAYNASIILKCLHMPIIMPA